MARRGSMSSAKLCKLNPRTFLSSWQFCECATSCSDAKLGATCITPCPTRLCSGFSTWPKTSLTTTWWACETCFSRWRRSSRAKKFCPPSANVRICNSVSRLPGSSLVLDEEIDNHAGLLHLSAVSPDVRNRRGHHHGTPDERFTPAHGQGR